jgi:hypothetical protein
VRDQPLVIASAPNYKSPVGVDLEARQAGNADHQRDLTALNMDLDICLSDAFAKLTSWSRVSRA